LSDRMSPAPTGEFRALAIFASYLAACACLTGLICRNLYKQVQRRGDRHHRSANSSIQAFSMLAVICLGITWYYMLSFFSLSYRVWVLQHGISIPVTPQNLRNSIQWVAQLQLGAWLKDVKLFRDAWEVAMETPGRLFWAQPIFFVTAAWSFYVGHQGELSAP